MKRTHSLIACSIMVLLTATNFSSAQSSTEPDFELAYVLATASFCAYTVGATSGNDVFGKSMAVQCLQEAAKTSELLKELNVDGENVEAYVGPDGKDAYLMIRSTKRLILAFRGTLPPPVLGADAAGTGLAAGVTNFAKEFVTFVSDWTNDANIIEGGGNGRHVGFQKSWTVLLAHFRANCPRPGDNGSCSKIQEYLDSAGRAIFVTGHSKGGALATLATVDLKSRVLGGGDVVVTTYTFEAPKAFAPHAMAPEAWTSATEKTANLWRFEYKDDVVPLLPLSALASVPGVQESYEFIRSIVSIGSPELFPARIADALPRYSYEPVGNLAFVDHDGKLQFREVAEATRLQNYLTALVSAAPSIRRMCRVAVEEHFRILIDIQTVATARKNGRLQGPAPYKIEGANWENSFFAQGLRSNGNEVMWGFENKCD